MVGFPLEKNRRPTPLDFVPENENTSINSLQSINETIIKDVIVIGNGPSGIILSYLLAGNWPYYNGLGESFNDMLHHRLMTSNSSEVNCNQVTSILKQDLMFLSQDLEGRSANPISLLFDTLNHPQADLGLELPSLLNWKFDTHNAIDHVVVGRGPPGGAWQAMDGSVLTISLGCWMELPEMNFREWESTQEKRCPTRGESRAPVSAVAQYYCDYVKAHKLEEYFHSHSVVTQVRQILHEKRLPESCDISLISSLATVERRHRRNTICEVPLNSNEWKAGQKKTINSSSPPLWEVKGYTLQKNNACVPFTYLTKHVVLASGASDESNILDIPGEDLPFVLHSLNHLEDLLSSGHLNQNSDPILVVGAGLSAADAIIAARFHSVPVIHVFRRSIDDPNLIFRQLPQNMYPEYHKVYQMMKDSTGYEGYKGYQQHIVLEIGADRKTKIVGPSCSGIIKVSYILVCIGSHPNLSFLGPLENYIGIHPGLPIDCKRNPVAIDMLSHESIHVPGLYALGPLIGENFVRFLQGGALAITADINAKRVASNWNKHREASPPL